MMRRYWLNRVRGRAWAWSRRGAAGRRAGLAGERAGLPGDARGRAATWWVSTWVTSWSTAKTVASTTTCSSPISNDLAFEIDDFNNWTFGGEWLYGVSNYLETGVSVGYYQRGVTSVYRDFVQRQRAAKSRRSSSSRSCRSSPRFVSCPPAAARRSSPTLAAASASSTGATPRRVSSSIFRTARSSSVLARQVQGRRHRRGPGDRGGSALPVGDAFTAGFEYKWQKADGRYRLRRERAARRQDRPRREHLRLHDPLPLLKRYGVAL